MKVLVVIAMWGYIFSLGVVASFAMIGANQAENPNAPQIIFALIMVNIVTVVVCMCYFNSLSKQEEVC